MKKRLTIILCALVLVVCGISDCMAGNVIQELIQKFEAAQKKSSSDVSGLWDTVILVKLMTETGLENVDVVHMGYFVPRDEVNTVSISEGWPIEYSSAEFDW
ncbi:MAG: hypothetical protein DRH15_09655 [Deltaproteobacteria bacterium]|nr:MAG: hypothetical protein DRH15_09655 [Deltaproteobacteria bacterium]